jgi:hypothetical protein|tara:strand:- start:2572 stop:3285 length:714 start_codon:yes stop_codon:yes gene_type:complete
MTTELLQKLSGIPTRTIINNENNNNNENNKKQLKSLPPEQIDNIYPFRESLESLREESGTCQKVSGIGGSEDPLPPEWRYLKIDLFDNGDENKQNLRVAVNILREADQQWVYARASINGPWRNVKRNMDLSSSLDRQHYALLKRIRDDMVTSGFVPMCSKMYQKGNSRKGKTIPYLSVAVAAMPRDGEYLVVVVRKDQLITRMLTNNAINTKQRAAGVISSSQSKQTTKLSLESLGI